MFNRIRRFIQLALIVVCLSPLFAHAVVGSHTRMMADDYCTSYLGRSEGLIGAFVTQYNTWAGQPSNILLKNAVGIAGSWVVPLLPPLVVLCWTSAMVWALTQVFKPLHLPRWLHLFAAGVLLFALLDGSPLIVQSLYWLAAVIPYTMPLVLATVFVGFLARVAQSQNPVGIPTLVLSAVFCFVTGGFSESYVVVQIGVLLSGIAACILLPSPTLRQRVLPVLVAGLIGTVLVLIVILAAPGNAVRRASFPPPPSAPSIAVSAIIHSVAFVVASLSSFSPVGAILTLAVSAFIAYRYAPHGGIAITPVRVLLFLMMIFFPITAYVAAGIYATTNVPPARTYIIPQTLIVAVTAFIGYVIGVKLKERRAFQVTNRATYRVGVLLLAVLVISGPARATAQILGMLPDFQTFAADFDEREQIIHAAVKRGETRLVVAPFRVDIAEQVGLETIGADPQFWVNGCAAQYYGLETLATE